MGFGSCCFCSRLSLADRSSVPSGPGLWVSGRESWDGRGRGASHLHAGSRPPAAGPCGLFLGLCPDPGQPAFTSAACSPFNSSGSADPTTYTGCKEPPGWGHIRHTVSVYLKIFSLKPFLIIEFWGSSCILGTNYLLTDMHFTDISPQSIASLHFLSKSRNGIRRADINNSDEVQPISFYSLWIRFFLFF